MVGQWDNNFDIRNFTNIDWGGVTFLIIGTTNDFNSAKNKIHNILTIWFLIVVDRDGKKKLYIFWHLTICGETNFLCTRKCYNFTLLRNILQSFNVKTDYFSVYNKEV